MQFVPPKRSLVPMKTAFPLLLFAMEKMIVEITATKKALVQVMEGVLSIRRGDVAFYKE